MAASTTIRRRGAKAAAAQRAAKERRQLYLVIALGAVLVIVVAVMVLPRVMGGSSTSATSAPAAPAVTTPSTAASGSAPPSTSSARQKRERRRALRQPPSDPFSGSVTPGPNTLGSVPNPAGLHDPFASASSPEAATAPVAPTIAGPPIKGTIVIGTKGPGTVAEHGWIVILASIPTSKGKGAATSFSAAAKRAGVGALSVLNSSNRRPLRGGYWVVYTGPFSTLAQVNTNAASVHGRGFTSAYIRQLIVYKKKG